MKDPESPNKDDSLGRIVGEEKICTTVLGDFRGTNLVMTCKPTTAFSLLLSLAASRMKGGLTACIEARALAWPASKEHQEYDPWPLVDLTPTDLFTRDMNDIFAAYMKTYHHRVGFLEVPHARLSQQLLRSDRSSDNVTKTETRSKLTSIVVSSSWNSPKLSWLSMIMVFTILETTTSR
jgi:hypothetical protein